MVLTLLMVVHLRYGLWFLLNHNPTSLFWKSESIRIDSMCICMDIMKFTHMYSCMDIVDNALLLWKLWISYLRSRTNFTFIYRAVIISPHNDKASCCSHTYWHSMNLHKSKMPHLIFPVKEPCSFKLQTSIYKHRLNKRMKERKKKKTLLRLLCSRTMLI